MRFLLGTKLTQFFFKQQLTSDVLDAGLSWRKTGLSLIGKNCGKHIMLMELKEIHFIKSSYFVKFTVNVFFHNKVFWIGFLGNFNTCFAKLLRKKISNNSLLLCVWFFFPHLIPSVITVICEECLLYKEEWEREQLVYFTRIEVHGRVMQI